ncbi:MAG: cysteine--tRNA ligase [Clostridia bacterium]|nr:cysteine--tRNA ligase [Clostridia bacterium]
MKYNEDMRLYNTLTKQKEEFTTVQPGVVHMYSCGPTVYNTAHIGNMRAYICGDILKKTLRFNGYQIEDVMNITDVGHLVGDGDDGEDKVETTARKLGLHPLEIAQKFTDTFMQDIKRLNITPAKHIVPATQCIDGMIKLIQTLEAKGYTYRTSDGIYFDASTFPNYFNLSKGSLEGNIGGARVALGEKRNINDFALWKFVSPNTIQKWDSPWGVGCPGWHIECSAISMQYLPIPFDIHTGGVDHIPVHHTNEIAQTESATGKKMCHFWFHNEFMTIDGGKMSKSLGNVYSIEDLIAKGYDPMHVRLLMLQTIYRSVLNFTFTALNSARENYRNIVTALRRHRTALTPTAPKVINELRQSFADAINNDLNTPMALAVLHTALKQPDSKDIYELITNEFDQVLSLSLAAAAETQTTVTIPTEITALAEQRLQAKKQRDWQTADELRNKITAAGYQINDTSDGYTINPIN